MFIKSEKYSVLQAACGIPVYFTKLKPVEEKIADITTASRSNRTSSIQVVAINEIMSTGQSILIKPIEGQIDGLNNIDTSFIGTYKITSIEYVNNAANITYYQNLPDIISTNIAAEIYSIPNIDPSESYLVEFFTESVVPSSAEATIRPARYVVAGNESFTPTTTIELRSKFSTSAKALVKMVIKNALTNKILRNEYIEIVMSDSDTKPCEIITEKPIENTFVDLNKDNEWTYNYQGYTLAQFIPYNKNITTSIQLVKKNNQLLPNRGDQNRFKVVVDPIKLANKKVTIEQIRNAVLQQFNTVQNYSVIANTVNKSYDIIFKDVLLQPQDLNDLVIAVVPPVTGTPVKLSDVADATNDGVISDRSEIPGISLLRWNENYIGELHFDRNVYLNDIINVRYNTYNLSGIIKDFYLGLNSLNSLPLPTPTNTPSSTPTSTATPTPTAPIIPDNIYACDFWENYFNGLYSLSYTDGNGKGVYLHDILDMNDEDTGVNTILSYDPLVTGWIISYCGTEEVTENCFAANFKSSSQVSPFGPWIRLPSAPQHYTAGSVGVNVCEGMPTSTPTQTAMQQAPTPTPTITPTVNELLPPTGFNIVCGECTGEGNPQNATVDLSWSYQIDPIPQGVEIHTINYNSEIIDIKLIDYPIASTGIQLPLSNDLTLFRIRSFGSQQYSSWNFFPYAFSNSVCCSPTATPTPTPTSTSALPTSTPVPPTPTPTSTSTPLPPTATPTSTPSPTPTSTSVVSIQYIDYSIEKYSCPTTNTVSVTAPVSVQSGDLLVAFLMRRSNITNSSSFTLLDEIQNPGSSTGQYTSVYTKIAAQNDAGSSITFTQSSNARMGLSLLVLRSTNNAFNIEALQKNSSSTDIPALPSISSSGTGRIAVAFITNTFANVGFPPCDLPNYITPPQGYQGFTTESLCSYADGESTPECQQLRLAAAYKSVNSAGNIHQSLETFLTNVTDRRVGQISFIVAPS